MVLPDLFGDVVDPSVKVGDRSFRSLPVSVLLHAIGVTAFAFVALTSGELLPTPPAVMAFVAPMATPAPPPPPPTRAAVAASPVASVPNPGAAPLAAPPEIRPETGLEPSSAGVPGGVDGGIPGGVVAGTGMAAPPAAPPLEPPAPAAPIRIGGDIRPPTKIRDVPPVYPRLAIQARVQGVVIVEADISADGKVTDARILRSIRLLDQAALDAVRQWEYTPTLLNGVPRPVVMVVTVNFFLAAPRADPR
jgi:periplasmic protein TonB